MMLEKGNKELKVQPAACHQRAMAKGIFTIRAELVKQMRDWDTKDLAQFLRKINLSECSAVVETKDITGSKLLDSNEVSLSTLKKEIGMTNVRLLTQLVNDLRNTPEKYVTQIEEQSDMAYRARGARDRSPAPAMFEQRQRLTTPDDDDEPTDYMNYARGGDSDDDGSWGTDFDEDDVEVDYGNSDFHSQPSKPEPQEEVQLQDYVEMKAAPPNRHVPSPAMAQANDMLQSAKRRFDPFPLPPDRPVLGNFDLPPDLDDDDDDNDGDYLNSTDINTSPLAKPLPDRPGRKPNVGKFGNPISTISRDLGRSLPPRPHIGNLPHPPDDQQLENYEEIDHLRDVKTVTKARPADDSELDDYEAPFQQTQQMRKISLPQRFDNNVNSRFGTKSPDVPELNKNSVGNLLNKQRAQPAPRKPTPPSTLPVTMKWGQMEKEKSLPSSLRPSPGSRSGSPVSTRSRKQPLIPASPSPTSQRPLPDRPIDRPLPERPMPGAATQYFSSPCNVPNNLPPEPPQKMRPKIVSGIQRSPWYFDINRERAKEMLRNCGVNGSFLIRTSSQPEIPYTLSVLHKGKIYNIPIRKREDQMYALGKPKENEQAFSSVEAMVLIYTKEPLKLYSGGEPSGETKLTISPPPSRN